MNGVRSFEERMKNPGLSIIDWEFITLHPEAKLAIWNRYQTDIVFQTRLNQLMSVDVYFKSKFKNAFSSYLNDSKKRLGR